MVGGKARFFKCLIIAVFAINEFTKCINKAFCLRTKAAMSNVVTKGNKSGIRIGVDAIIARGLRPQKSTQLDGSMQTLLTPHSRRIPRQSNRC
jgi:glycine/serine hydroxymethyltransferase